MRPRKLYHQRIIVITQRGISRERKQRAMPRRCCLSVAAAAAKGWEGGREGRERGTENLAICAVRCVIIPRVVNVIVRARTNCEPCETVNRGVTRFRRPDIFYARSDIDPALSSPRPETTDALPTRLPVVIVLSGPTFGEVALNSRFCGSIEQLIQLIDPAQAESLISAGKKRRENKASANFC